MVMIVRSGLVEAFQTTMRTAPEVHCDGDPDLFALEPLGLRPHDAIP